ncbi:MAG: phospholipid carrier-dependent glycosyltransferase [Chloroflexota bacterium]|nr:MAG: phospholipid carrier-dependent glycosyltransferase [Chloroflexota bacterium]
MLENLAALRGRWYSESWRLSSPSRFEQYMLLIGLTLLAGWFRFYRIDAQPLWGDEYASIREAQNIGTNPNSLIYFLVLRVWMDLLGQGEATLRMPAAIFGTLAVPVTFCLGRELFGRKVALLSAALLATSPYAIELSQLVRYYSLFLLCATLGLYLFVTRGRPTPRREIGWAIVNLLCVFSFLLGFLVPLVQAMTSYVLTLNRSNIARRILMVVIVSIVAVTLLSVPSVREWGFAQVAGLTAASERQYSGMRGLSLSNLAKIPLAFFFFTFGERIYPLDLVPVIPGLVLCAYLGAKGLTALGNHKVWTGLLIASLLVSIGLVYLVFDSLIPSTYEGAQPQFIVFILPIYYLVLARGVARAGRHRMWLGGALLILNLSIVFHQWSPGWSYRVPLIDWHRAAGFVTAGEVQQTMLLYDGRMNDPVSYYFPPSVSSRSLWDYDLSYSLAGLRGFDRLVFMSNDSANQIRGTLNRTIGRLQMGYAYQDGYVSYPLFVYEFARKDTLGHVVDPVTGVVDLPKEIYGLHFSDLRLPQQARYAGLSFPLTGSFALPTLDGTRERTALLSTDVAGNGLMLLSNLTEAEGLPAGEPIAEVAVYAADGQVERFLLRNGVQTNDWASECASHPESEWECQTAFSWHKRAAMVGQRAYEGAWKDFQARIFGTTLAFEHPLVPARIEVRYVAARGVLNIWGAALGLPR